MRLKVKITFAVIARGTTQPTNAGSNASERASAVTPTPSQAGQSTTGASKSQEKPSASAAKTGEAGASKAKKRLSTSDTPGPSAAKVSQNLI